MSKGDWRGNAPEGSTRPWKSGSVTSTPGTLLRRRTRIQPNAELIHGRVIVESVTRTRCLLGMSGFLYGLGVGGRIPR